MNLIEKYLGEESFHQKKNILTKGKISLSLANTKKLYKHFYGSDVPRDMSYAEAAEKIMSNNKNKIKKALEKMKG